MKKIPILLILLLYAVAAQAEPVSKPNDKQIFSVTANAEIFVKPDRMHVTFGVSDRSKDLLSAKDRMNEILKKAISFCRANGIQEKSIRTSQICIRPEYRYDDEKTKNLLRYYELTQTFTVTLENPDTYEPLLYGLLNMGINKVENVSFTTSELRKYKDEARLAAVKAAQEKAKLLTDAVGIKLGKVINIQEGQPVGYQPYNRLSQNTVLEANANAYGYGRESPEGSFALGTIPVRAEVTVMYELE